MGEVAVPGTYTLSSFSSVFHALYRAGGVNKIGSLRSIKVVRNGKTIADLDVYDYLMKGKMKDDIRLQEGDVIIVNPYESLVRIAGKVKRPMFYEMKPTETVATILNYAGGFTGDAYKKAVRIIRKSGREHQVYNVDEMDYSVFRLDDGDSISVDAVLKRFENRVEIRGAVYRSGLYELSGTVNTVKQLIKKAEGLRGDAFLNRALLDRENEDLSHEVIAVDLGGLLKGTVADIPLQKNDILYIPTNSLDEIRKYVGGDEGGLKVNKLGTKEWLNTKAKVKKNLRQVAKELIELYAKREKSKGYAFPADTPWQTQFEDSFPYQETDDQLRCIDEVKKDMENSKPMDRLLCGDVGYGKTEVAIRAAFKAVMGGKQVAYLAPTTVLAEQQYKEFKERMTNFGIRVEVLNRFKTKKQQTEIINKLKLGEVDIVVGTHRILSKDVEFKDLGLLIIDEEHRFGVKDKEKIKQYKATIDVLTMTATPIPRTLHMSIVGVRDMSVIYEPPYNRKPVQTYVLEYDQEVIKEAITRELERNGQVFYLFNNVERIIQKADEISNLVPEAKVVYAHGQMTGHEIENIMEEFIEGKTNVLVCTTILESGIDIPNANTIIVENADRMGLAQLYQIRGRVGRSDRQGYAYITYKRDKLLSEIADKRLKAIKEFTEFGSGFKIAMRDLEIRGAGSLLGEIQSGHLEQVGYDTYCNLLDEVVKEMQGEEVKPEIDVQIDLDATCYIPDEYISDSSQKIEIYQDIALCKNEEDIQNVIDEMIDRFGNMPSEIENLIEIARIKILCKKLNISKVQGKRSFAVFTFELGEFNIDVNELAKNYRNRIKFSQGLKPQITYVLQNATGMKMLKEVEEFLKTIDDFKIKENK